MRNLNLEILRVVLYFAFFTALGRTARTWHDSERQIDRSNPLHLDGAIAVDGDLADWSGEFTTAMPAYSRSSNQAA